MKRLAYKLYILLVKYLGLTKDKWERPEIMKSITQRCKTSCGKVLVSISFDSFGQIREVFFQDGSKGCRGSQQGIGRLCSLALRYNVPIVEVLKQLELCKCPHATRKQGEVSKDRDMSEDEKNEYVQSCAGAAARVIRKHIGKEAPKTAPGGVRNEKPS